MSDSTEPEYHTTAMAVLRVAFRKKLGMGTGKCEWPATVGSSFKCGKSAKDYASSPSLKWGRLVCGTHARSAAHREWVLSGDPRVRDDGTIGPET